jgi:dTDP-4-amino-4,6-dideoxygalactose transaminase
MTSVKFLDLQAQYESIKEEVDRAVLSVLASSQYVLGPEVEAFEREFAAAHGVTAAVAVNTGTSALHIALLAADVGPGDEVITVPMTFTASGAAIAYTGATPVFVDVESDSFTMDLSAVEAKVTPRTKAILPVHLYGQPADMNALTRLADKHGLTVIEDAAQAHLAEAGDRRVGGIGHAAAFSFYPGKNLGAYGEGGMATTNDPELARRMRLLRDWGQEQKYHHKMIAYNYRMDAIQGAILRVKLRHLEEWTGARRRVAEIYQRRLANLGVRPAQEIPGRRHVYHVFSIFHPRRDELQKFLGSRGIQTGKHYPVPLHLQECFAHLGYLKGDFPISEQIADEQLSLPIYPEMNDAAVETVCDAVGEWLDVTRSGSRDGSD